MSEKNVFNEDQSYPGYLPVDALKDRREKNASKGLIILNGIFDEKMLEYVYFELLSKIEDKTIESITIYVHSDGGQTTALLPMVDLIASSKKPIGVVALGRAYSAGAMLLLSGHKGRRYAHRHTEILLHEVSINGGYRKVSEMTLDTERVVKLNEMLCKMIADKTKMTKKQITRYMRSTRDEFITAEDALKYGIIDKII